MSDPRAAYLQLASSTERQVALRALARGAKLPVALAAALLELELPVEEKLLVLRATRTTPAPAYEALLVAQVAAAEPEVDAAAMRLWLTKTPRALAADLLRRARAPGAPLRLVLTVLQHAWELGGKPAVAVALAAPDVPGWPDAAQALLLRRLTQWGVADAGALRLAERLALKATEQELPRLTALEFAVEYLAQQQPETLHQLRASPAAPRAYADAIQAAWLVRNAAAAERLKELDPADPLALVSALHRDWPPVYARRVLPKELVASVLERVLVGYAGAEATGAPVPPLGWELFAGLDEATLEHAVAALGAQELRRRARAALGSLLPGAVVKGKARDADAKPAADDDPDAGERSAFFAVLAGGSAKEREAGTGPWSVLRRAVATPAKVEPAAFAAACRQVPPVFFQAVCAAVQRFGRGGDELLPLFLERLNGGDDADTAALAGALAALGTPQAVGYLVKLLGRPGVGHPAKVEACRLLAGRDLGAYQAFLREVLDGARAGLARTAADLELADSLQALLTPVAPAAVTPAKAPVAGDLDNAVRRLVPDFDRLPSEARRALRTALLFHETMRALDKPQGLDVSPCVDGQYKALEIYYRLSFAEAVEAAVRSGRLQRQLELIGYAPGNREKLAEVESYLVELPVVRDIPQISRFKLGRTLMGVAQLGPGKRFTLDGLKGYAFFFLAFARRECPFGLAGAFPLPFGSDRELAELCRDLHVLHDVRNQAVHEGLVEKLSSQVQALWGFTASLVARTVPLAEAAREPRRTA